MRPNQLPPQNRVKYKETWSISLWEVTDSSPAASKTSW